MSEILLSKLDKVKRTGAGIVPEAIRWLWSGWLAKGKVHILGGAPGTGKTTIALSLAATVSTGGSWPDGKRAPAGNVIVWSGEDDPADTLTPRLLASGADMTRIWFVGDTNDHGKPSRNRQQKRGWQRGRR